MEETRKTIDYLGIKINYLVNKDNFKFTIDSLLEKGASKIYTVNPEFIVDSYFDRNFFNELNSSDINIIDGVGLLKGIRKYFKGDIAKEDFSKIKTFTGVDLTEMLLDYADKNNLSVLMLGGNNSYKAYDKAVSNLKKKYPKLIILGSSGFNHNSDSDQETLGFIKQEMKILNLHEIDILLVGYGHKNQEFWISRNASKIPARLCVGVGGTIDLLAGITNRAPVWMRELGLEWLYRFITQPSRIFRIIKATLLFSYLSSVGLKKNFSKK